MYKNVYFYLKDESVLEKYDFEESDYETKYCFIWGDAVWFLRVNKETLRVSCNKAAGVAILCKMYKNGDLIITDEIRLTETQKAKKLEELKKAIKDFEGKYGIKVDLGNNEEKIVLEKELTKDDEN